MIAVVAFALAYSKKSLDFTQLVVLALTLWQAVSHFRHVPFFAILCGFWIGPHLHSALARLQERGKQAASDTAGLLTTARGRWAVSLAMLFVFALLSFQLTDRLTQLKVDRNRFPVDAFEYIADKDIGRGRKIVVTYDWAQYAIAAFCCPDGQTQPSRVAFDGRFRTCYPQEVVDMHFDWLYGDNSVQRFRSPNSLAIDPARVLEHGQPDLVILQRDGELTEHHMNEQVATWVLLYQDSLAQVWGRRQKFDNPNSPFYRPASERNISNRIPVGYASWPALPIKQQKLDSQKASGIAGISR